MGCKLHICEVGLLIGFLRRLSSPLCSCILQDCAFTCKGLEKPISEDYIGRLEEIPESDDITPDFGLKGAFCWCKEKLAMSKTGINEQNCVTTACPGYSNRACGGEGWMIRYSSS